jgi:hypothetical protein
MKTAKKKNIDWLIEEHGVVDELFLDQQNIRLPMTNGAQSALIQDLFSNEDAFELVKSYMQNGVFPDEFPIVVRERAKFVVIEGNRRLAALKALNEPDLVPTFKEKIKAISKFKITRIRVVVAPNRKAAIKHIANKHTINFRRPWKPLRQAYFYKSQLENGKTILELKNDYPEHDIPKFIRMLEMHHLAKSVPFDDTATLEKVHDERKFPITNLERMYENPYVQEAFGFSFDSNGKFKCKIELEEFRKGLRRVVEDVAYGEIDSRKTNNSKQIQKYVDELPDENRPDLSKKGRASAKDFKEVKVDRDLISRNKKSTPKPDGLFLPSHVPFRIKSTALRFLYDELRLINVAKFPNATHDLLRSFLECALIVFFKQVGEYENITKSEKHNPKLGEMLTHIVNGKSSHITDLNLIAVVKQVKTDYDSEYSLERMNMINHNENWNSTEKDVRSAWAKIESLFRIILNPPINDSDSK